MPVGALLYLAPLAVIAAIDIRTMRAPNRYVYPLIVLGIALSLTVYQAHAVEALVGGVLAFVALLVIALLGRGQMGMGDVKYGVVCGIAVGVYGVFSMLAFAFLFGAAVSLVVLGLRLRRREDVVAFTPFLFIGVLCSLAWSRPYLVS